MSSLKYPQKVVLVGDCNVGKSTLIRQLTAHTFQANWKLTTSCSSTPWQVTVEDKSVTLLAWDTPGDPNFNFLLGSACRNIEGAMLVYDVTVRQTFEHVSEWFQYVTAHSPPQAIVMLVGTRNDKEREVTPEEGEALARELGATFVEMTCTSLEQVTALFTEMARRIVSRGELKEEEQPAPEES